MCSSDSKNKRICQTLNSFCFLRYVFRQGAVFILGILIHSFLLLFSFFSKDQNFYDNLFYQCPCLNKFAKSTKSTSCSRARFGIKRYSFLRWRTLWTTNSDCNSFLLLLLWKFGGAKSSV